MRMNVRYFYKAWGRIGKHIPPITQKVSVASAAIPPTQSELPAETWPRLKMSGAIENDLPPKVKLTFGIALQGTL